MREKIILIGWDGADWNLAQPLVESGRMPQLKHMIEHGASGILRSSPPYLSPMLWTTIATGKSPTEHGIAGFREFNESSQTLQPISSRSRQCKAIWNILSQEGNLEFMTIYYHFLDWICHDFMALAPPQRQEISDRDYSLYSDVVSKAYELQDLLLRDLLRYAGNDVNCLVISDHGFLSGNERPSRTPKVDAGIAAWHRVEGIIVGTGPLFETGVNNIKATHFDIVPTLLHMLDLPVGTDMPGQVLSAMVTNNKSVEKIPSWESRGIPIDRDTSDAVDPYVSKALLKQFEDLGYISPHEERKELTESKTRRENACNLGIALVGEGRMEEALPYLEEAYFHHPEASHIALPLARCQIRLGLVEESLITEQSLLDYGPQNGELNYNLAKLHRMRRNYDKSFYYIEQASKNGYDNNLTSIERGMILLYTEGYEEAENIFRKQIRENSSLIAKLGLCRSLVLSNKLQEAEERSYTRSSDNPIKVFDLNITHQPIVIVSGLPRSGTSMMMQMLQKGGMTLQVDDKRPANRHNPRGFFEWEPIKSLDDNPHCISRAVGKVIKVVSSQLQFLPRNYTYYIIWMSRPIGEVARSQQTMLQEQGNKHNALAQSEELLQNHQEEILQPLRSYAANPKLPLRLTEINYADCINHPVDVSRQLAEFLGELLSSPENMKKVIAPSLYRIQENNRIKNVS